MQKRTQVLLTFLFIIFMVTSLYLFTDWFSRVTGYFLGEGDKEKVTRCLIKQSVEFYGTEYCAECEKQKGEFGQYFRLIKYVDCGRNKVDCPNIQSIPAWYINKEIHYGFRTLEELKKLSQCE